MTLGLTIPGVETVHPREVWEPNGVDNWYGTWYLNAYGDLRRDAAFHREPGGLDLSRAEYIATHYTSAIDLPDGDPDEIQSGVDGIRALLARSTYDYLANRSDGGYTRNRGNTPDGRHFPGYPLGYSWAFDWLGGVWEINGLDYQPAATASWNPQARAYLMLTDRYDPGSALMWQSFRAVAAWEASLGARITPENIWPHGKFFAVTGKGTPTGCCGSALTAQIDAGLGDWTQHPTPEEDMRTIDPYRAYDSRPEFQDGYINATMREQNKDVPKTVLQPGQTREIVVGMSTEVFANVVVIGKGGAGFLSINDPTGATSPIGYDAADRVEYNGVPLKTPGGKIKVMAVGAACDFAVDVFQIAP